MTAVFHISGTNATDKSCSKIIAKGKATAFLTRIKNKGGSISGPAERLAFNLLIAANTSCTVISILVNWGTFMAKNWNTVITCHSN